LEPRAKIDPRKDMRVGEKLGDREKEVAEI